MTASLVSPLQLLAPDHAQEAVDEDEVLHAAVLREVVPHDCIGAVGSGSRMGSSWLRLGRDSWQLFHFSTVSHTSFERFGQ